MKSVNTERNNILFIFWEKGTTIDEASKITGIPRSSVGYYWGKFNKYQSKGKPLNFRRIKSENHEDRVQSNVAAFFAKSLFLKIIIDILQKKNTIEKYYELATLKLLIEFEKYFTFTPEEIKTIKKIFEKYTEPKLGSYFKETQQKKKSLKQILNEESSS